MVKHVRLHRPQKLKVFIFLERIEYTIKRWIKIFKDNDCFILYHLSKVNVVVDALSTKSSNSLPTLQGRQPYFLYDLKRLKRLGA